ncbi:MAG: MOSC domain-containing protein [Gemmatimonadota bacterium]
MHVSALYLHPLKSGRRVALDRAALTERGFAGDRTWMVVRPDGAFLTGREHPRLTQVAARVEGEDLELSTPGGTVLHVPPPSADAEAVPVRIWGDDVRARAAGGEADRWLSDTLGFPCRLVRLDPEAPRTVDPTYARPSDTVGFADGFPVLVTTTASLEALNARLPEPLAMTRFRPNLVVDGATAFAEDGWRHIRVGETELALVKPCARCVLTTVDPETGEVHPDGEPLRTLATFRRSDRGVLFGQNAIPRRLGTVRVGDPVEVVE